MACFSRISSPNGGSLRNLDEYIISALSHPSDPTCLFQTVNESLCITVDTFQGSMPLFMMVASIPKTRQTLFNTSLLTFEASEFHKAPFRSYLAQTFGIIWFKGQEKWEGPLCFLEDGVGSRPNSELTFPVHRYSQSSGLLSVE